MKSEQEINELRKLISSLNDGRFMNSDYRNGILDTLDFCLYDYSLLQRIKERLERK